MRNPSLDFDWQDAENPDVDLTPTAGIRQTQTDAPEGGDLSPRSTGAIIRRRQPLLLLSSAFCLVMLTLVTGFWVREQAHAGLETIEHEILLAADASDWRNGESSTSARPPAPRANHAEPVTAMASTGIHKVDVQKLEQDSAAAIVYTQRQDATPPDAVSDIMPDAVSDSLPDSTNKPVVVRRLRFFELRAEGWVEIPAQASRLFARTTLQTEHAWIVHSEFDAAAVEEIAGALDALYGRLRADYGLDPLHTEHGPQLYIELTNGSENEPARCNANNRLCIPSPALTELPATLSPGDALHAWVLLDLLKHVRAEARNEFGFQYSWTDAVAAIRRLQLRLHNPQLESAYDRLLNQVYVPLMLDEIQTETDLQARQPRLCNPDDRIGSLSIHLNGSLYSPCSENAWMELRGMLYAEPPQHLAQLTAHNPIAVQASRPSWMQNLAYDTVLDYAVDSYGRAILPELIAGFQAHDTWTELIPAVFGISVTEFEAGWQRYLRETYAIEATEATEVP